MTTDALRRLRVRIALVTAVGLGLALGVLAAIAIHQLVERRHAERDGQLQLRAALGHELAYQMGTTERIDTDDFQASREVLGDPPIVVLDAFGRSIAGPTRLVDAATGRRLVELARPNRRAVFDDGDQRVAIAPIDGEEGIIGTIVALTPRDGVDDSVRNDAIVFTLLALGGWALGVGLAWWLGGRTLRPALDAAQREQAFLADAAHELRTPLAVIRARAEGGGEEAGALDAISRAAGRAGLVVEDMLAVAYLEARDEPLQTEPVRIDFLVEQVADELAQRAADAGISIHVQSSGEPVAEVDQRLLSRALTNLIANAIKHGGIGGDVRVAVDATARGVIVTVSDQGPGVAPAQRTRIFDRFYRGGHEGGGAGLGLAIARLVAEAHGGTLELLEARPEEAGAQFRITLPRR